MLPHILCIVGPTSSGKTAMGLRLAKERNGEIINADARQVYRGFDIGTGKPKGEWKEGVYLVDGVVHHLMDDVDPMTTMTVAEWRERALSTIHDIVRRGKLPIVVGGTGLYVQALVDAYDLPHVPPQKELRDRLEKMSLEERVHELKGVDPQAASVVDLMNPRRVQRALEVALTTGRSFVDQRVKKEPVVNAEMICLMPSREELYRRIDAAVDERMADGWLDEVRRLHDAGIPWDAPAMTSIGYRELGAVLRGEMSLEEATVKIKQATRQYAKRQMTWFKKYVPV
ncbi:MAG: tRNA (adenosine(37)-N6)-dimethylallyltransferase MiaA [Patescibacteria group bacterium]